VPVAPGVSQVVRGSRGVHVETVDDIVIGSGVGVPLADVDRASARRCGGDEDHDPQHEQIGPVGVLFTEDPRRGIARGQVALDHEPGELAHLVPLHTTGGVGPLRLDLKRAGIREVDGRAVHEIALRCLAPDAGGGDFATEDRNPADLAAVCHLVLAAL
jgi:hypothetical protein